MSTFFQDMTDSLKVLAQGAGGGLVGAATGALTNIAYVEACDIANRQATREVLKKRASDPKWKATLTRKNVTEWLEATGKYDPEGDDISTAIDKAVAELNV